MMKNIPQFITLPLALLSPVVMVASAYAEELLTVSQAQQVFFSPGTLFIESAIQLTDAQMGEIKKVSGVRQRQAIQQAWRAEKNGTLLGWFMVDNVIGKHEFITYGAAISVDGKVLGVEVLNYRETHGGQVKTPEWRKHFVGKTLQDTFKLNQDIPNISGATLSCRNVTDGVKRLLAIHKIALHQ